MRGEIICVGDELTSGRVGDANARYAAGRLWPLGLAPAAMTTVGDDPEEIVATLVRVLARCDWLIVSGGLGTTEDDLTAAAAAQALNLPLVEEPGKLAELTALAAARGRQLTPEVRRMALMPAGAVSLDPRSAGFSLETGGKALYFLPGVPEEFARIIERRVLPELAARLGSASLVTRTLRVYGLPESEVGRRLAGLAAGREGVGLGYYPVFPEVLVVLSARAESPEAAQAQLEPLAAEVMARLADHVVVSDGASLEERVGELLKAGDLTLACAESCTGGLIGHRLTQVAGSSAYFERGYVVYSNRAKTELLDVKPGTIARHGAVSEECALEMALGARINARCDLGLSVTGIAGPEGGSPDKPVGTVWFGLSDQHGARAQVRRFFGDRRMVKLQAAETALDLLRRHLEAAR
ncbi:MAG: CinA family nicotinamide mononucleotide deamidase-related protein [Thermodesulfobacteriota bacterium]